MKGETERRLLNRMKTFSQLGPSEHEIVSCNTITGGVKPEARDCSVRIEWSDSKNRCVVRLGSGLWLGCHREA